MSTRRHVVSDFLSALGLAGRPAAAVLIAGSALMTLSGCQSDVGGWRLNYTDYSPGRFDRVPKDKVVIERGHWEHLTTDGRLPGLATIGSTHFSTYGELSPNGEDPDRTIRAHASDVGAEMVQWDVRQVADAEGNMPARYEYVAVYYRGYWRPDVASAGN